MALNKLLLRYEPSGEDDIQSTAKMSILVGRWERYRKRTSTTEQKVRPVPKYERFECVKRRIRPSFEEWYDFDVNEEEFTMDLSRPLLENQFAQVGDWFEHRFPDSIWNVVMTIPKKAVDIHEISQTTEFLMKKIFDENYSYLIPEIDRLTYLDTESALKLSTNLEEAMNLSKLEVDDPLQKRKIEDFQWNLIEIKKMYYSILDGRDVAKIKNKLKESIKNIREKMLLSEEMKKALDELDIDRKEVFKEFEIKKLPKRRVEYVWKKSG